MLMLIQIDGRDLPGATCSPAAPGHPEPYENIHVGIGRRGKAVELFRGDSPSATWRVEVQTVEAGDGSIDFRGPFVDGKRGDRFVYLNWVTVDREGDAHLFRRGKVMLTGIDPALVRKAVTSDWELHCTLVLTDVNGHPSCARFKSDASHWSLAPLRLPSAHTHRHEIQPPSKKRS